MKNIQTLNEQLKNALNEDVATLDFALQELAEAIESAKMQLDKCYQRVIYRVKENISYTGDQAMDKIYDVIDTITAGADVITKNVYNDIIG